MEQQVKASLRRLYINPKTVVIMRPWQKEFAQALLDEEYYRARLAAPNPGDIKEAVEIGLVNALITQGRLREAYEIAGSAQRVQIRLLEAAEERDDKAKCEHQPTLVGKQWSERYQDFVSVHTCAECGFINITPETVL